MGTKSLAEAIRDGDAEAVRTLLATGVNPNARNGSGLTHLMQAAFYGHSDIAKLLLNGGANARYEDVTGLTAADWALRKGHKELAGVLNNAAQEGGGRLHTTSGARPDEAEAPKPAEKDVARDDDGEISRLARELEEARRLAAEERCKADEAESAKRAEESARRRAEEQAAHSAREAERLALEAERLRKSAEDLSLRVSEADTARQRAEEEARLAAADAVRLRREFEDARLRFEKAAQRRAEGDRGPVALEERRQTAAPSHNTHSRGNALVVLTVICGLLFGGLIGTFVVSTLTSNATPVAGDARPARADADDSVEPVRVDGALRGREVTLPAPLDPDVASRDVLKGAVTVKVEVNNRGEILSARALDGHPLLQQAAVRAARKSKFSPQRSGSKPATSSGIITYNFPSKGVR